MHGPIIKLDQFLPYRLSIASNAVSEVIASAYQRLFGLKIPEWRLLAVIAESKGISQLSIGQRTRMDKVTVSRAAIAMQSRGLIERMPNHRDGRSHLLTLTQEGQALYSQVVPAALALEKQLFDQLSTEEREALDHILSKICAAADGMTQRQA
jgi:DNA-binding MarR family transcriptional regulator